MNIQLAYSATALGIAGVFSAPLDANLAAAWAQISAHPANPLATVWPIVHEARRIQGFVDTDQASAANGLAFLFSDDGVTIRATVFFTIPANAAGQGSIFNVQVPGGKFCRLTYTNGAVAQTRFNFMANLTEVTP